uniref:Retrotransposon gag domain-containing protein n=1 Tax=Cajanus cajan TaxID=3821 RepID=A0A151QNA6_CAJCA|nr:hypothetical protein KK1_047724 [Cajanus cajan]
MSWMTKVEKIFVVMECPLVQMVSLATFLLVDDAHFWWERPRQRMLDVDTQWNWENFRKVFLEKYFAEYMRCLKEMSLWG